VPVHPAATPDEALGGGEDYELLAALPDGSVDAARDELADAFGTPLTDIGVVTNSGLAGVDAEGSERELVVRGWDHFGG
jgi:thiamine monophosphate kinase